MREKPTARPVGVLPAERRRSIPDNLWCRCPNCSEMLFSKEMDENLQICPKCEYHFPLSVQEHLDLIADPGSYKPLVSDLPAEVRAGRIRIGRLPTMIFICSQETPQVVALFVRAVRACLEQSLPLITIYANVRSDNTDGTQAIIAAEKLAEEAIPQISVLMQPSPEFGYLTNLPLGDVLLAEPLPGRPLDRATTTASARGSETTRISGSEMIDQFVDRRECAIILRSLLVFFGSTVRG